jgi:archaellum biogenesis ATPase FlaH
MRRVETHTVSSVKRQTVDWALSGRIPVGHLSVLIGEQGLGKSTWLAWLAAEASKRGQVVLVCSAEDDIASTIKPRLEAWEANLDLVRFVTVALDSTTEDGLLLPDDVEELTERIRETEARIVTIDPILAHLGREIDSHRDASTRQALAPLARIAGERQCAIVGAHHLNKGQGSDPLRRASASVAFTAQARSVLLWARDPDDPEGERGSQRALAHVKCNLAALAPTLTWEIESVVLPASASEPAVETSRVVPVGESEHTGRDLLAQQDDTEPSAIDEAREFLLSELASGPVAARKMMGDGRQLGIAERTLRRAAKRLGVETRKSTFAGGWEWVLPLTAEDGQAVWPPAEHDDVGHLRQNGSTMPVSSTSEAPKKGEDGQANELAIFASETCSVCGSSDVGPVSGTCRDCGTRVRPIDAVSPR